jgi:hypothetical protein
MKFFIYMFVKNNLLFRVNLQRATLHCKESGLAAKQAI